MTFRYPGKAGRGSAPRMRTTGVTGHGQPCRRHTSCDPDGEDQDGYRSSVCSKPTYLFIRWVNFLRILFIVRTLAVRPVGVATLQIKPWMI
jgi:hypothetical protein